MDPEQSKSNEMLDQHVVELIEILKDHDVDSPLIVDFLDRHHGTGYFGELQSVLDIKELLDMGLLVVPGDDSDG